MPEAAEVRAAVFTPEENSHISGCKLDCPRPHLTPMAAERMLRAGVPGDLIRAALTDEVTRHELSSVNTRLSTRGLVNLQGWGASQEQLSLVLAGSEHGSEPTPIDFAAKERERVAKYREGLGDAERRARNNKYAREYRERRKRGKGDEA